MVKIILLIGLLVFNQLSAQNTVIRFEKFEIDLTNLTPTQSNAIANLNPFDKREIICKAVFTSPAGEIIEVNGFWYQECSIIDDPSKKHPSWDYLAHQEVIRGAIMKWKIRFTPTVVGIWNYAVSFILPLSYQTFAITNGSFNCISSSIQNKSFITINRNPTTGGFFQFADGTPFTPLGINLYTVPEWKANQPKVNFYTLYFKRLRENGANLARLALNFYGGIYLDGYACNSDVYSCIYHLDRYNLASAYLFDEIIKQAELYNIKLDIRIFSHEDFLNGPGQTTWKDYNSYNLHRMLPPINQGNQQQAIGVCADKNEFFTLASASQYQNNFIKYIIDRWGYSTAIFSWSICSEADNIPEIANRADPFLISWHKNKIDLIHGYDAYSHSVTTEFASSDIAVPTYDEINKLVDFVCIHRYLNQITWNNNNAPEVYFDLLKKYRDRYKKPVIITESGNVDCSLDFYDITDSHAFSYHQSLWSTIFQGSSAPYFDWTWEAFIKRKEPLMPATDYMKVISAVSEFLKQVPVIGKANQNYYKSIYQGLDTYYYVDLAKNQICGWVQDENYLMNNFVKHLANTGSYLLDLSPSLKPVRASISNKFAVEHLPFAGKYRLSWYDTETGIIIKTGDIISTNGSVTLTIPSECMSNKFGDVAFLIEPSITGWVTGTFSASTYNSVLPNCDVKTGNDQIFYSRAIDGIIHTIYLENGIWRDNWVNPQAPKMKDPHSNTKARGLEVVSENNNEIFYTGFNGFINRLYFSQAEWQFEPTTTLPTSKASLLSELHYGDGQLFYVRGDGIIHTLYKQNGNWVSNWLNPAAPKSLLGTGFALVKSENNAIYYVAPNQLIYKMYYLSSGWQYEPTATTLDSRARTDTKLYYGHGQLFYVRYDGIIHVLYKENGLWVSNWLNPAAPKVKSGTGMVLMDNNDIFYVGEDSNIYKIHWITSKGWLYDQINLANSNTQGAKENSSITSYLNYLFYVSLNGGFVNILQNR